MGHAGHTEASGPSKAAQAGSKGPLFASGAPVGRSWRSWSVLGSLGVSRLGSGTLGAIQPVGCLPPGLRLLKILALGGLYGIVV